MEGAVSDDCLFKGDRTWKTVDASSAWPGGCSWFV